MLIRSLVGVGEAAYGTIAPPMLTDFYPVSWPTNSHFYAMLCYAMLCYAMLCYAMLCYAMLCYAVLCYAMLCYTMLCYAMLCYAMLCYAIQVLSILYCQHESLGAREKCHVRHLLPCGPVRGRSGVRDRGWNWVRVRVSKYGQFNLLFHISCIVKKYVSQHCNFINFLYSSSFLFVVFFTNHTTHFFLFYKRCLLTFLFL